MPSNPESLQAISALDGRYKQKVELLALYVSEQALMSYRVRVEAEYFIALSNLRGLGPRKLSTREISILRKTIKLSSEDAERIKTIEATTNHDVKAVEYFMREKLASSSLKTELQWLHFGLTSEDVNNISYALMLRDTLEGALIPHLRSLLKALKALARTYAAAVMLARTHGQPASPTTFGKEMSVFAARLERELRKLEVFPISAKLNSATGNYNALVAAAPKIDWPAFSKKFIVSFNKRKGVTLSCVLHTTQIEPHDTYAELFQILARINTICMGFDQDIWRYVSDGWVKQKAKKGEVGSSTMPHKINPIDFENSEGNLGVANALLNFFAQKLPISRLQRDLSDSTVERNFGTALAHAYLGYDSLLRGLGKIEPDTRIMREAITAHPEVLAEAIQIILRREGVESSYELLKDLTRGKQITLAGIRAFIKTLPVSDAVKKELQKLTPENYIGLAAKLAKTS
ncbi:adenylosuccinate lyase [Acetobacteraceae bacterium]|nr:adenylosuccinate lyase [Candidatus Parcubacteria bacterium]